MDLDHALRVFRQYCWNWKRDQLQAESLLLTDQERQAIQELKKLLKEHAGLFATDERSTVATAA